MYVRQWLAFETRPISLLFSCSQARFFTTRLGIPAMAVNRDTWNARESSVRNVRSKFLLYALAFADGTHRTWRKSSTG